MPREARLVWIGGLVVANLAVAWAIHLHNGEYTPLAISLITVAILATILGIFTWPVITLVPVRIPVGMAESRFVQMALLLLFVILAIGTVRANPTPHIDVWVFQQQGADELLHGRDPYAMTFPDIYHSTLPGHQQVYGAGLVVNDRLQFGFPYPPVSLILSTLGYAAAGDHRYAQVVALALAGLFIAFTGRGFLSTLAMALLLFTPRVFYVIEQAWTEPFVVMLLAATIFCAVHRSRWLPIALGLFLATKQYLIFAVPFTFFLLGPDWTWRRWFNLLWQAAIAAAIVTLPFALWNFHAFWKSTVTVQQLAPFRWDALSYIVWWGFHGHGEQVKQPGYASLPSIIAALLALAFSLRRAPRTPAGFAAALALLSLGFFAFNKQAFCNYYFFVIGALSCAIAATSSDTSHHPAGPNTYPAAKAPATDRNSA